MTNCRSPRSNAALTVLQIGMWAGILGLAVSVRAPDLRVIDLKPAGTNNAWRLRWNSVPGTDYQVQRTKDDRFSSATTNEWLSLVTVRATNNVTVAEDVAGSEIRQRFYRVVQFTNSVADGQPPTIAFAGADAVATAGGEPSVRVRFLAGDNVGIASLTVREGTTTLGQATPTGGSNWVFSVPAVLGTFQTRVFTGIATDPSGNTAQAAGNAVMSDSDRFVPLNNTGGAMEGRLLASVGAGQTGPFRFRPGGRVRPGAAPDLFLDFPDGATFLQFSNRTVMEFVRVHAGFDAGSPFQFGAAPRRDAGPVRRLGVGPVSFGELASLFDIPESSGIAFTLFNRFPIRWRGGAIDDRGWPGAEFLPEIGDFPLPGWSRALPGMLIEFARERTLRIPFAGEFPLPDGTANAPRLRVSSGSPLWLTLRADGRMSLNGPVEIGWPNGQSARAELTLDDPKYCLALEASGLRVQSASNLVDLLPNNPAACVPAGATSAQLAQATRCLDSFARAYQNFSALVAASSAGAPPSAAEPPGSLNGAVAALEAWGFSATTGVAQALPLDAIAALVTQVGRQSVAMPELPEVLANRLALMRARRAVQSGALNGSTGARSDLDAALAEAEAAALDRVRDPGTVLSLAGMKLAARLLVDTEAERQLAGLLPGQLLNELPGLFQRFADRMADSFGVSANVFAPDANPAINNLNRFVAIETLRDIVNVQANAQLLGVNLFGTRLDELTGQLGVRLLRGINTALDASETAADLPAFALAAQDLVELGSWVELGLFPSVSELTPLGNGTALGTLGSRLNSLAVLELDRPFGEKTMGRHAHEVRALLRVLREMPGTATFTAPPFRRAYDKLEDQLNLAVSSVALAAVTNTLQLVELMEAGTLHRELGARFNFPQPVNWETNRLPQVVTRLGQIAATQRGWRELDQAVRLLLDAADRAGLANDQNLRRVFLAQSAVVLATSRTVARALWQDASGLLRVIDFALPGDVFIERPAGSICYDRVLHQISGECRGALRLPKFGFALEILGASFDSGGRFRVDAFGRLDFPQPNPIGSASIPRNRPLRLSYSLEDGLRLSSDAELTFDNGIYFRGSILIDDPLYEFGLEAGGFQFHLAKALGCESGPLPPAGVSGNFQADLTAFHGAMAESLTKAAGAGASEPDLAPATRESDPDLPPPDVTAWKHFVLLHASDATPPDIRPTLEPLLSRLETETDGLSDEGASLILSAAAAGGSFTPATGSPLPKTLQVDVGTHFAFSGTGPAHQDGLVPAAQTAWNVIGGDRSSGLIFADGSPANGVSIDFGRSLPGGDAIDWSLGVGDVHRTIQLGAPFGPLQNELMSDGVTTLLQPGFGARDKLGVRVLGLEPAAYQVYAMAAPFQLGSGFRVEIGRESAAGVSLQPFNTALDAGLDALSGWVSGVTHVAGIVSVRDASEVVVVVVSPTIDTSLPLLNGLQIVAVRPQILSFTATAYEIQQGESPELRWTTAFTDDVKIDPGGLSVASNGSLTVRPRQTTTYTLIARGGPEVVTATVTITVNGAGRNVAGVVRKLNRVTAMTKEAVDAMKAMANAQLRNQVDAAAFARMRAVFTRQNQILEQVLDDPAASADPETARNVAKSMLNVSANSLLSGFEGIVDHAKIIDFYDRSLDEFEDSLGFDPQTGAIDQTVVRSKSADESIDTVKELLNVAANAIMLGSDRTYNEELIKAYLIGAREDLLDLIQFDRNTGHALLDGVTRAQLREAAAGLRRIEESAEVFGNEIKSPPAALQQLADALQQLAVDELNGGRVLSFSERLLAVDDLRNGNALLANLQQELRHGDLIIAQLSLLLAESARNAGPARRLTAGELEVMSVAASFLSTPDSRAAFQLRLEKALRGFNLVVATPLLPDRINQGRILVAELGALNRFARALTAAGGQPVVGADLLPPRLAEKLTTQFTALAREKKAGKQLKEFNAAMLELAGQLNPTAGGQAGGFQAAAAPDPFRADLLVQSARSLGVAAEITDALCDRLGTAPADLSLPDFVVERVFGSVLYNRESGFLSGRFGGSVKFPGLDARFAIREAFLSSDGSYRIAAAMAAPLTSGRLRFASSLNVSGTPAGVASFNGDGTLSIDTGGGFAAGSTVAVSVGYDSAQRELSLGTAVTQLRLSDQVALINGSVAAEFATDHPQGALMIAGKLGLLARAPLPTDASLTGTNFWLVIDALPTQFVYTDHDFTAEFTGGSITLPPDLFRTNGTQNPTPVTVGITGRLCVRYDFVQNRLEFCGAPGQPFTVALQNFQLSLPELPGFALAINTATLELSGTQFPVLKNLAATLTLPLPGADAANTNLNRSAVVAVNAQNWRIDGLPEAASVALGSDLRLADFDGFTFDLLSGSGLAMARTGSGAQRGITFTLTGNLRAGFDQRVLTEDANGTAVRFTGGGSFAWNMRSPPVFTLSVLQLEGNFRLGQDGPRITGLQPGGLARLSLTGLENIFHQSPDHPFVIGVEGAIEVPDVIKFGLIDTKFILDGTRLQFRPGGVQAELGNQTLDIVQDALPVYLSKAGLSFKNSALPLIPGPNQSGLFDVANVVITISGGVNLPNKAALDAGSPGFAGEVNDLAMTLRRNAQGDLQPEFNLNGLGVELKNVDIPPLGALTGGLYVGNLNDPDNLYFAGTVSGTVNDVGAGVTLALHRQKGFLGACFELDVGPAGIPLDGGALGGILLTGGKGGLSFGNQFADPCDFRSYIRFNKVNGTNQPVNGGGSDSFNPTGSPPPVELPPTPPPPGVNSCIVGEFPPATINPLCEALPGNPNRIIFKGTALNAQQLATLGFTAANCPRTLNAAVAFAVGKIAQPVRNLVGTLTNAVPPGIPVETRNFYSDLLNKQLRQLENTASSILSTTLGQALDLNPTTSLYDEIVTAAAQGIPCLDATLKLQGNFSHAAVSTVLKGEGAVIVSTTGTALMQGAIKLIGIPIGEGTLAFSLTDSQGHVNPSFGGVVHAGVGPLTLGDMSLRYECDSCFDTVINAFGAFLQANANNLGADVRAMLVGIMNRSVPLAQPRSPGGDLLSYYNALTPRQRLGFVTSLFNIVDVFANGGSLPGILPQTVAGFVGNFRLFITDVLTEVNPVFCFQAKVRPTIFGFPMIPGPTPLDARFGYERGVDPANGTDYQQLSANAIFSPTFIMNALSGVPVTALLPANDQVNFGFSFRTPAFTPERVELALSNPAQFAAEQFSTFVEDSVMTFGYTFMPLGIPLAEGQARVLMPRLDNHPSNPQRAGGAWQLPAGNGIAKREDVIIAALVRGRLQDPNWRGQRGELDDLFVPFNPPPAPDTAEARLAVIASGISTNAMKQYGLAEDYFPYGGFIGASRLDLPKVFASAPPLDLMGRVLDLGNPNWLADAQELFDTWLTKNASVGQMAVYFPAANPPFGFNFSTNTSQGLIRAISQADVFSIVRQTAPGGLYAFDQVLVSGWMKAPILGMPLAEGLVILTNGHFRAQVAVSNSWLRDFIGATANLEIRPPAILANNVVSGGSIEEMYAAAPRKSVEERFAERRAQINGNPAFDFISNTVDMIERTLPKTSLEMAANVQIPGPLQPILKAQAGAAVTFFAFSPAFDPAFGRNGPGADDDDNSPYAVAKRRGGLGIKGAFDVGLNLQDASTANDLRISIPDASFSITPDAQLGVFPALNGQLRVADINLPFMPRLRDGRLNFSSSPVNLAPFIGIAGKIDPFDILIPDPDGQSIPIAQFKARGGPGSVVGGILTVFKDGSVPVIGAGARLEIEPMRVNMPLLGPNVAMTIYGGVTNGNVLLPFRFSSSPNDHWSATVKIHAANNENGAPVFGICDPRTVTQDGQGNWVGDPASCAMSFALNAPIIGSAEGVGFDTFRLAITLPKLTNVVFFPGRDTETTLPAMGAGSSAGLIMIEKTASDGLPRFHVDLGTNNLGLPGVLSASGRLEFGYNPTAVAGVITPAPASLNFGTNEICATNVIVRQLTVSNLSSQPANVLLSVNQPDHYTIAENQFVLGRNGGSRTVDILFHPRTNTLLNATLTISSDSDSTPTVNVPLSGRGSATARYFQSRDAIAFGDTVAGDTASGTVVVVNEGCANMTISGVEIGGADAAVFTVTPAGAAVLQPGQSRLYRVEFEPTKLPVPPLTAVPHSATLTIRSSVRTNTVSLTGNSTESRWLTLLDSATAGSSATLNSIHMLNAKNGWAVGDAGTVLETKDGGRSWRSRVLTPFNLRSINVEATLTTPILAAYHFEEPPEALQFRDDGPNGYHARAETDVATAAPTNSGASISFDGINDVANIAAPLILPTNASISLRVSPQSDTASDVLLAQTDYTVNATLFSLETAGSGGYRVRLGNQSFNGGTLTAGSQHLAVTLAFNSASNTTTVRLYKDGTQLWSTNFTGAVPTASSRIWGIGARYQTLSSRTSFFTGGMDEIYFFSGVLSSGEIATLARGGGAMRLMIAGDEGTLLQSETLGRSWHKANDLNVDGFRQRLDLYNDYDWLDVVVGGTFDKIVLGGARRSGLFSFGEVMVEDLFDSGLPSIVGNEHYDEASFPTSPDASVNALVRNSSSRVYAFTSGGRVFQSNGGNLTNDWLQHGTLDVNQSLNDATMVSASSYVAVGNAGRVIRSVSGAVPEWVFAVTNDTLANLLGVAWVGATLPSEPEIHAVGNGGVYLRSTDLGATWTKAADGLIGNNRSISVRPAGTNYEAWTAGDQHRIQYRPPLPLTNGFVTFHPGELDFGMLTIGESRTLPLEIRNRGKRDMQNVNVTVTGTGFSLVQAADISRIAPGDVMVVQVRYKPTAAIVQAPGALQITAADSGGTFTASLIGRASDLDWQAVTLSSGGVALSGDVIDLAFTTDTIGYALMAGRVMKTTDGGSNWVSVTPPFAVGIIGQTFRSFEARRVGSSDVIYMAGSVRTLGFPQTRGTIWRSSDGGTNWVTRTPPISGFGTAHPPFGDVAVLHDDPSVVVCATSDPTGLGADVWQSSDGGVNWTSKTRPPDQFVSTTATNDSFGGGRVVIEEPINGSTPASAGWMVVATDGSAVYSTGFDDEDWPYGGSPSSTTGIESLQFDPLQTINAIQFGRRPFFGTTVLATGWIVGAKGLYWRWVPRPDQGIPFPFSGSESDWFPAADQEVFGRTDLEAVSFMSETNNLAQFVGWIVGGSKIFGSRDSGASWFLDYDTGESNVLKSVFARSRTNAWAGGSFAGRATVWRYRTGAVPAQGILSVNDVELFAGSIAPGATSTRSITLRNIGNAPLRLQHIGLEDNESSSRFRIIGDAPTNLAVNATATLPVAFDATPDPVNVEALAPRFFHRFEQGFTDTMFFDSSSAHADIQLEGARLVPTNNRPRILFERERRDRSLRFDGNDYAEVPGFSSFPGDFSVAFWVNPTTTNDSQTFVSKHNSAGADRLLIGFLNGGYHVQVFGQSFEGGDKRTGWQHIAVTGARTPTNTTLVTVHRDGELLWQQSLGALLGNAAGLPWLLGAERDSSTTINDFLTGQMDDVGLWDRLLTETEIQMLAAKSPTCGEHVARLVFQTDSENGERTTELRATVAEGGGAVVIQTDPPGASVIVDGVSYPTPVTFAVGCTASTPKEWLEGSQHTIEAPASIAVAAGANTLTYGFADWSMENIGSRAVQIVARPNLGRVVARYRLDGIDSPGAAMAFAAAEAPLIQAASVPADLTSRVGGTPQGPWFRLTGGNITVSNISGSGFAITGEMFASLTRIKGSLASTAVNLPSGSAPVVEIGAAQWQLDLVAGQYFRMRTRPPSLTLLGRDIAPDGEFGMDFDFTGASYTAGFALRQVFRPAPNFFEVGPVGSRRAGVSATVSFPSGLVPRFEMTLDGRVRVLRLPANVPGTNGWAIQQDVAFRLDTANFNLSLKTNIVGVGGWPATLFSGGPFALNTSAGDFRIVRVNNGPIVAMLTNMSLSVNGQTAATVSGSVGTDTSLNLNGSVAPGTDVRLRNNARFAVKARDNGPLAFKLGMTMLPPRFVLDLPPARLTCAPGGSVDDLVVNVPGISFDTSGAFDTGKIPLPTGINFDGINVNKPSGASLENNHIRLKRDADGKVAFKLRARHLFEIAGVVSCRNQLKVTIDNNVSASYRGNFCVLPEPISLGFDGGSGCQFRASGFDQTIYFGSDCIGIRNDTTRVCLGDCPP